MIMGTLEKVKVGSESAANATRMKRTAQAERSLVRRCTGPPGQRDGGSLLDVDVASAVLGGHRPEKIRVVLVTERDAVDRQLAQLVRFTYAAPDFVLVDDGACRRCTVADDVKRVESCRVVLVLESAAPEVESRVHRIVEIRRAARAQAVEEAADQVVSRFVGKF